MPKFRDIPTFTNDASYEVTVGWKYLNLTLKSWDNPKDGEILDMNPDFQRGHVWTKEQQIRYVEYILRNGMSSRDIYWNNPTWMKGFNQPTVLVDGKQRLNAALEFLNNKIPAFGYFHDEYTDSINIVNASFNFHVNDLKTRKEVLQWYLDLNTGGVVHTNEEIKKVKELLSKES